MKKSKYKKDGKYAIHKFHQSGSYVRKQTFATITLEMKPILKSGQQCGYELLPEWSRPLCAAALPMPACVLSSTPAPSLILLYIILNRFLVRM